MSRKRFGDMACGVAQALEQIGDWWTLLIVRDAFLGLKRFAQFEASLGISKNILTDRIQKLVDDGILSKTRLNEPGVRYEYTLTDKGRDLWVLLTAMRLWSDKWVFGAGNEPLIARDRKTGRAVKRLLAVDASDQPITPRDLEWVLGPGKAR
ncbi:MAG: helix-turn-helix domain-containing protein [Polyangiales bacterium]